MIKGESVLMTNDLAALGINEKKRGVLEGNSLSGKGRHRTTEKKKRGEKIDAQTGEEVGIQTGCVEKIPTENREGPSSEARKSYGKVTRDGLKRGGAT